MFSNWKEKFDLSYATFGVVIALSSHYSTNLRALVNIYTENAILGFIAELCIVVILALLLEKIIKKYVLPFRLFSHIWFIFIVIFPYFFPYLMGEDPVSSFLFGVWANFYLILFGFFLSSISKR